MTLPLIATVVVVVVVSCGSRSPVTKAIVIAIAVMLGLTALAVEQLAPGSVWGDLLSGSIWLSMRTLRRS